MIERLHHVVERAPRVRRVEPALRHLGAVDRVELTEVDLQLLDRPPRHERLLEELHALGQTAERAEQPRHRRAEAQIERGADRLRRVAEIDPRERDRRTSVGVERAMPDHRGLIAFERARQRPVPGDVRVGEDADRERVGPRGRRLFAARDDDVIARRRVDGDLAFCGDVDHDRLDGRDLFVGGDGRVRVGAFADADRLRDRRVCRRWRRRRFDRRVLRRHLGGRSHHGERRDDRARRTQLPGRTSAHGDELVHLSGSTPSAHDSLSRRAMSRCTSGRRPRLSMSARKLAVVCFRPFSRTKEADALRRSRARARLTRARFAE